MPRRRGLSLMELALAALILGVSGVVVVELIRSSTVHLEITEAEALARGLAADVLERYASSVRWSTPQVNKLTQDLLEAEVGWDDLVKHDPWLNADFPRESLAKSLDLAQVRLRVHRDAAPKHPALGNPEGLTLLSVTVSWTDHDDRHKEVTLARFVAR